MLFIKKFTNLSLKYKFLIVFFVFITLPTIFLGVLIYLQSNELLKEQAQDSTQSILDKIEGNLSDVIQTTENISAFAIYNEDFRTFMTASKDNFNKPFYRQSIDNIKGYLTFQLLSNEYINSIAVKGENGNFINFGEPLSGDERHYDRLAIDKEGGIFWSDIYELHSGWSQTEVDVISLSRVINDYNNIKEHIGFIRIRLDSDKLANIIEIPNLQGEAAILLTDMNKKVIMNVQTSKNMIVEQSLLATLDQMLSLADYSIEKDKYLIVNRKVAGVDWNLTAIVNKNQIAKRLVNIKQSIRNMVIFLTVFGLIALIGYYYSDVRRIINLTKTTERMEKKDFSVRVYDDSKDEIGVLGYRFNKMVETIRNHIDIEYKLKLSQKESEMKALQSQIDPHFLYNTLDMIRWKARMENANETSHLIELLSKIFRNTLRTKKLWIPIEEELQLVKSYLVLQEVRMNGNLHFSIIIDHQIENLLIIKQTIQPLVENAIKHGFYGKKDKKIIKVRGYIFEEKLIIDVVDNGSGMNQENFLNYINHNDGHALKNLQERINLAFGTDYGLRLMNEEDSYGTWIRVHLPIISNESDIQKEMGDMNRD